MGPEGLRWHMLRINETTLRTYGHYISRRDVVKQENYSGLHYAPDQERGDTYIRFYEMFTLTNWGRSLASSMRSFPCMHLFRAE